MNKIKCGVYCGLFFCQLLVCCNVKKQPGGTARQEMLNTDIAFSEYSKKHGMKKAFIEYIDDDGVLLRPNHMPIVGAYAIDFLTQVNDSSFTLSWKPLTGNIAGSNDLGYTYGVYNLQLPDTALSGTYVTIWKKQPDGKWKFVLDSGNEGIQNPNQ